MLRLGHIDSIEDFQLAVLIMPPVHAGVWLEFVIAKWFVGLHSWEPYMSTVNHQTC